MYEKLNAIKEHFKELESKLSDPGVIGNQALYKETAQEHASLSEIVSLYDRLLELDSSITESEEIIRDGGDPELAELAKEELASAQAEKEEDIEKLKIMLIPKDKNDDKNVILEIRAGTGGDEAALFGGDLLRMYNRYAERKGFTSEVMSSNITELGGVKEIIINISGKGAYSRLKYESGVHRVQRIPETESGGRIHTSAATVAVLPEAEEVDIEINPNDLRIDVFRAGGHGGQCVNTTDSAVRITHIPTGIVATCQDEKSQLKNKDKCMKVLASRLYAAKKEEEEAKYANDRKSQIGSGDRSERIRTYNFPQGRVTDHRIGLTLYKLEAFLDGDMDEIIDALTLDERQRALKAEE
ncbi:MAG: peptide chain release factor 1 [Christensenellaceae bacterium]|nr:peptide chain release factor 1 [Christensenellaceae bacterium]